MPLVECTFTCKDIIKNLSNFEDKIKNIKNKEGWVVLSKFLKKNLYCKLSERESG